jgi:hypothetical protein
VSDKRVPPPELLARLRIRYEDDGLSTQQIADEEGLAPTSTRRLLRAAGTKMRPASTPGRHRERQGGPPRPAAELVQELCRMYEAGLSTYDLEVLYGYRASSIWRWLKAAGVTSRRRGNPGKTAGPPPQILADVTRRHLAGFEAHEIAKAYRRPEKLVRYWLSLTEAVAEALKNGPNEEKGN